VVGRVHEDSPPGQPGPVERLKNLPDAPIHAAHQRVQAGHVAPHLGLIRQVRQRLDRLQRVVRLRKDPVRLREANHGEERRPGRARPLFQELHHQRRDAQAGVPALLSAHHGLVAQRVRIRRFVLQAEQVRRVATRGQQRRQERNACREPEPAVRQPHQAVAVRRHARQQAGTAGAALRRSTERLAEQHALARQPLDVRRGHAAPIGPQVAPGVVRDHDQYIRLLAR
jgi:hypothetical protein